MVIALRRMVGMPLVLALLIAGGCSSGDGDDSGVATLGGESTGDGSGDGGSGVDAEAALLDFSRCMREEGLTDFPDLTASGNAFTDMVDAGIDLTSEPFSDALSRCQDLLEGIVSLDDLDPNQIAEIEDTILGLALCLRGAGYDVPDPDFSKGIGPEMFGDPADIDIDLTSPEFAAALRRCFLEVGFPGSGGDGDGAGTDGAGAGGGSDDGGEG